MDRQQDEIECLQNDIINLKSQLREKENRLYELKRRKNVQNTYSLNFSTEEVSRYSRQMLVPSIGITGQIALKASKVLIVGTGGLGCPAALYLAAAGVGEITLVDNDEVDLTNLHRQVLHTEADLAVPKVQSGCNKLKSINSSIKIVPVHTHLDSETILKLFNENKYDVVVDGTDNVATRYLLNDMCVIKKTPLVSGSALQMEGQLTVYNYSGGPCYRCMYPVPPPPETVTSCGDGGVLGAVPGVIGVLEALEAIKVITKMPGTLAGRLLLFDGGESSFRNITLRKRNENCDVCGVAPVIRAPIDYEQFCGAKAHDKVENISILEQNESVGVVKLAEILKEKLLLDVRSPVEFEMCHLPNSLNIPYTSIENGKAVADLKKEMEKCSSEASNVYVICRRGNDSQRAICKLKKEFASAPVTFINVRGGLHAYSKLVDPAFPVY